MSRQTFHEHQGIAPLSSSEELWKAIPRSSAFSQLFQNSHMTGFNSITVGGGSLSRCDTSSMDRGWHV